MVMDLSSGSAQKFLGCAVALDYPAKAGHRGGVLIVHDPRCAEYERPGHPERPARTLATAAHLRRARPQWAWASPGAGPSDDVLLLAHTRAHLDRLEEPGDFDGDTPWFAGISERARASVAAALDAAAHAAAGKGPAFSLMRPPGHHACAGEAMGFCYLNQVAVAALAQRRLGERRVAIWDFDAHHGNGTESIVDGADGVLFCSVHQYPGYPGTGTADRGNLRNWSVPPGAPRAEHMAALRRSLDAVLAFGPDLILVSAGFDAYRGDPITEMSLDADDFATLGAWLREGRVPAAAVLEGGYSQDLPVLVEKFLAGWSR
jgi:acetoin utilization deacetylase AcuC-like enzyme